jgi:hypothetical protein
MMRGLVSRLRLGEAQPLGWQECLNGLALLLLLGAFLLSFGLDVHHRDALSWMDPNQSYRFARALLDRQARWNRFELPTIFPYFLLPFLSQNTSIASALWVNALFAALLGAGVHLLCRELNLATPSVIVVAAVLASPLLVGLSRELYVEFALSALVALTFVFWLRMLKSDLPRYRLLAAVLLAFGLMTKMTFPVYFLAPFAGASLAFLVGKQYRSLGWLLAVVVGSGLVVLFLQYRLFPISFRYYKNLGYTNIPIMSLIGPGQESGWRSALYYYLLVPRYLLGALTVFLVVALVRGWTAARESGWRGLAGDAGQLALWFLGSLTLLTLNPVKEPRHVAPSVVPAVLLAFWGLERFQRPLLRPVLVVLAVIVALGQYLAVTQQFTRTPYYLSGSLHLAQIEEQMRSVSGEDPEIQNAPAPFRREAWAYNQSIAITGFEPNAALALTWHFFPAVVIDLDVVSERSCLSSDPEAARFQDLFLLSGFSTYNRRIGVCRYYETLPAEQVVGAADFILVQDGAAGPAAPSFPGHELMARVETANGPVRILKVKNTSPDSYRMLYAREYLAEHPSLSRKERNTIAFDQFWSLLLRKRFTEAEAILAAHPDLRDPMSAVNRIHWIGQYEMPYQVAQFLYANHVRGKKP